MKRLILLVLCIFVLSGTVLAQDAPTLPPLGRLPLVECSVEVVNIPCVEIVNEASDLVGTWRRYYADATSFGYISFSDDGRFRIHLDRLGEFPHLAGTVTFADGIVLHAADPGSVAPAECVAPGSYEMRLIRVGDQPVALTYRQVEDPCPLRTGDFAQPMLYVTEFGQIPPVGAVSNPLALALVPCPDDESAQAYPCDVIATSPEDIAGVWKQYLGNPAFNAPNGMGYVRHNSDGSFSLADSLENTATPYEPYPFGTVSFDGPEMTITVDSEAPSECETAVYYMRVIRFGSQTVAMIPSPVNDRCIPRRDGDMSEALIRVGE